MKCVKDVFGQVIRVSDEKAKELVGKGKGYTYSDKSAWKKQGRKYEKARV